MIKPCHNAMVDAIIRECGNIVFLSGIDGDLFLFLIFIVHRNIAEYSKKNGAVVLTGDSDFCLFDLKGVVYVNKLNESKKSIRVVTRSKILSHFNINEYQLFYLSLLRGNDYVGKTSTVPRRPDGTRKETIEDTLEYVRNNNETRSLEGCRNDYREHHPRGNYDSIFEIIYQQVFMEDIAEYPFNMVITRNSDSYLLREEGLNYGKLKSTFLNRCSCRRMYKIE